MTTFTYTTFTSNAGHSAKSPGASGYGYKEHEQARLCNKAFINQMKARGYSVTDTTSDARNKAAVLQEQVAKANKVGKGNNLLHLSFHLNSASSNATGTEVLHYGDETKELATKVSAAVAKTLGIKDRGAKERKDLYFLRKTNSHAILIEVCFISSENDMEKFTSNYEKAMRAVADILVGPVKTNEGSSTEKSTSSTVSTSQNTYKGSSIIDYLKSISVDSSFSNRKKLAVKYGIVKTSNEYKGTATQNTALLKAMRGGSK